MTDEERLSCHCRYIRTFSNKVIVIVDRDTRVDPSRSRDLYERLNDAGFHIFLHHIDVGETHGFSSILYCEFDTDEEAVLFKLGYL